MLSQLKENETKNVPYFVQAQQRAEQDSAYYDNFTPEEHKNCAIMFELIKSAYNARDWFSNVRKTMLVVKADHSFDVNMDAHAKLTAFAHAHGFEHKFLKGSQSTTFFYKKQ